MRVRRSDLVNASVTPSLTVIVVASLKPMGGDDQRIHGTNTASISLLVLASAISLSPPFVLIDITNYLPLSAGFNMPQASPAVLVQPAPKRGWYIREEPVDPGRCFP
jgi:hypothetical protein